MNAKPEQPPYTIYISLGSNIQPRHNLPLAIAMLRALGPIQAVSTIWETPPVGTDGSKFLNAVICIKSPLEVDALKTELRQIEAQMGRVRTADKYAPRPIDLDILIHNNQPIDPEIWEQPHLAIPLAEVYPDYRHPQSRETIAAASRKFQTRVQFKPVTDL
ncbi:MAG: 2-amino-4-hydroxy-6-hydroxymethyldihydropteridine diphosphokinase [Anaerolineales bacterium]|nr:2-amino-4-hydroxy-6-hydroxymethyldihydropteridine diphosphokinase [Anaerolineales bacterium]